MILQNITLNYQMSDVRFEINNLSKYNTIKVEVVSANHINRIYLANYYGEK